MIDYQMGLGPQLLQGPGSKSAGSMANPIEIYSTPLLDLTQLVSNIELVPAKPGLVAYMIDLAGPGVWLIEQKAGTQTSPPTIQAGTDAAHQNFISSNNTTPSNANFNAATSIPPFIASGPGTGVISNTLKRTPNLPVFFDITAPAAGTGGYICMARLYCAVMWVAVGS